MMDIMHVFEETRTSARKAHIKAFFGNVPGDDDQYNAEDGSYIVCYCGARLIPLKKDKDNKITNAAVWHNLVTLGMLSDDD